ncbi:DUF2306 domain-containing protein [Caldimonas brevitalea]|uniref:Membrane protein n=1 Tax=Caldimonas brevitalea TaxID=413882 RepID=A0A0G3BFM3_9BURK|nr:DUF2306 domain-containing protein [Caldimonas brevitalea]AKJ28244.1 membrane protein [Caldimonas brevitalea]
MSLPLPSPAILLHIGFAVSALLLGPFALTARKGSRWHRGGGYAWVTLMLGAALTSVFIRDYRLPNIAGYTPIHLVTLATFAGLGWGIWSIAHHRVQSHRRAMWATYISGCLVAGAFALLPQRYLGRLVWQQWLGLM